MSAAIAAAVVVGGATVYAASQTSKASDKAMDQAEAASQLQYDIAQQQIDLAKEQWGTYRDQIFPLELEAQQMGVSAQELALQRGELDYGIYEGYYAPMQEKFATEAMEGVEAQPERAARDARIDIDQAYDQAEGQMSRSLQRRGVRPGAGGDIAGMADTSLNRAAAKGFAVNRAVEAERDRAEDINFNRKAVALGRQPLSPMPTQNTGSAGASPALASGMLGQAAGTAGDAGRQSAYLGNTYAGAAGDAISSGIQLGTQAYDIYNKYRTPTAPTTYSPYTGSAASGAANFESMPFEDISASSTAFYEGGPVNAPKLSRNTYAQGGQVNGPPGVDQVPAYIEAPDGNRYDAKLTDDEYVIPADVVKSVGTDSLDKIIEGARMKRKQAKQNPNALARRGGQ